MYRLVGEVWQLAGAFGCDEVVRAAPLAEVELALGKVWDRGEVAGTGEAEGDVAR